MKHKDATVLYCNTCRMTTPHSVTAGDHTCKRCGAVKTSVGVKQRRHSTNMMDAAVEMGGLWN